MRVIAGEAKGRRLKLPKSRDVRPSSDRLKEAMFASLGARVEESRVLDLFAGSGALGIEALSRGAVSAVFVERDRKTAALIEDNLQSTGFAGRGEVIASDVYSYLENEASPQFDVVLIDPPYDLGLPSGVLELLAKRTLLAEGAVVVVEAATRKLPFPAPAGFELTSQKSYGDSSVLYFQGTA